MLGWFKRRIVEHHYFYHQDKETKEALFFIKNKLKIMNENLEEIKSSLLAANEKVSKVSADVTLLHTKVDAIPNLPTAEEWAEVKAIAANLNTSLQEVDDKTAEETAGTPS